MRVRTLFAAVAAVLALAGCGTAAVPRPPSAASLARKLGCGVFGPGEHFAAWDVVQDVSLAGNASPCAGGEIWTFPTAKAEQDWLHQVQIANGHGPLGSYPAVVAGTLWAVYPGGMQGDGAVVKRLGGREITFI